VSVALAASRMPVPTALSDLFFNHDNDAARLFAKGGEFDRWDEDLLAEEAATVLGCLESLGLSGLPEPEDLVEDFLGRC
jgi:hypothetical protein